MEAGRRWLVALVAVVAALGSAAAVPRGSDPVAAQDHALPDGAARGRASDRLALLIGIDEYDPAAGERRPPSLSGAKADVSRVRDLLIGRFGFAPDDVRVLVDGEATHEAIVRAFHEHLIARAGPRTEALFWFSGHGSLCADAATGSLSGETGRRDSTFVAWDSRSPGRRGAFDVTDDELHSLLHALARRTSRITVVTDSCHSGGAVRGSPPLPPRFAPEEQGPLRLEEIASFWPPDVPLLDDADPRRAQALPYVHLAACGKLETAHEHALPRADGGRDVHGAFTWFLLETLEGLAPGASYEELGRLTSLRLASLYRGQEVQLEGDLARAVLGGGFAPPVPGFNAVARPQHRTLRVDAGTLHQLRAGSELAVTDLRGRALGAATVVKVFATNATAQWIGDPPPLAEPLPVRVIERTRPRGVAPLRIAVPPDPALDRLAAALAAGIRVPIEVVRAAGAGESHRVGPPFRGGPLELTTVPDGRILWRTSLDSLSDALNDSLIGELAEELRLRDLLALAPPARAIPISLRLTAIAGDTVLPAVRTDEGPLVPARIAAGRSGTCRVQIDGDAATRDVASVEVTIDAGAPVREAFIAVL